MSPTLDHQKIKVLTVFGTRPEAIKMAPVVKALQDVEAIDAKVCVTAQHREMLDQVLDCFAITPDFDLDLMRAGQGLAALSARLLTELTALFERERPDLVLVHGDTATTAMASIAAYYAQVAVGHVEAGLRTGDIYAPWPEEVNRRLAGSIASLHFAPTERARGNLLAENVDAETIAVTGNTVVDALMQVRDRISGDTVRCAGLAAQFAVHPDKRLILVTGHRRESFGDGFEQICHAIRDIAARGDVQVVFPVHLNPQVREPVHRILGSVDNVRLIAPLDYEPFVYLMSQADLILTDSGGIQEEAPALGVPVLVMRDTTERPEAVAAGTVKLVGAARDTIVSEVTDLLDNPVRYAAMRGARNPYGDGHAALRIADRIAHWAVDRRAAEDATTAHSAAQMTHAPSASVAATQLLNQSLLARQTPGTAISGAETRALDSAQKRIRQR